MSFHGIPVGQIELPIQLQHFSHQFEIKKKCPSLAFSKHVCTHVTLPSKLLQKIGYGRTSLHINLLQSFKKSAKVLWIKSKYTDT